MYTYIHIDIYICIYIYPINNHWALYEMIQLWILDNCWIT
jgi:hypothetical protein